MGLVVFLRLSSPPPIKQKESEMMSRTSSTNTKSVLEIARASDPVREDASPEWLPEWQRWKGPGPKPASWWATNPATGQQCKVYRSYEDYCND